MEIDYKGKIRKLLALAESNNEHEAKAALLKAKELMAEHKITEAELGNSEQQAVKNIMTEISCSKRRNPWICNLSATIGENYCCQAYRQHSKGKQTQRIGFIGLEDDVEICVAIFKYAVDCILAKISAVKKENAGYWGDYIAELCNSYGYGFNTGLREAFEKQMESNEQNWGLVLVMPQEVTDDVKQSGMGNKQFRARAADNISRSSYREGYEDGKKFDPQRRLA